MAAINSYMNIISFVITTVFYYLFLKPKINVSILLNDEKREQYTKSYYMYLVIYFLSVILVQFAVNSYIISDQCGGNIAENLGTSALMTFLPWTFIFGILIIVLVSFPGLKSAFADVVGYFYVSSQANNILSELLIDSKLYDSLDKSKDLEDSKKRSIKEVSDLLVKLTGNMGVLINQLTPNNFMKYWSTLTPLMKDKYQQKDINKSSEIRDKLLSVVETRDNIGEGMWYIYTGILLCSIIQYNMVSRGCQNTAKTMQKGYQEYLDKKEETDKKNIVTAQTTYNLL